MEDQKLSIIEHLSELRRRLLVVVFFGLVASIGSYTQIDWLIDLLVAPAGNVSFIYLSPPELFSAYIKISLIAGFILTSPITLYQVWAFIKPGLKPKERKMLLLSLYFSIIFFVIGTGFAYYVILPITLEFFIRIASERVDNLFSFSNYISFCGTFLLSFGLVFQMPIIMVLLTQLDLVKIETMRRYKKYFVLVIFIVAALITPPDVVSQVLLAVPMVLLYEMSLNVSSLMKYRKSKKLKRKNKKNNSSKDQNL